MRRVLLVLLLVAGLAAPTRVVADPGPPLPVEAPAGSSMHGVARDGAIGTRLSDGRTLWAFADTLTPTAFVSSTAAYATANAMTVVREPVASPGRPYRLVDPARRVPGARVPSCPPGERLFTWPSSAVTVARARADDVLIYVEFVCGDPARPIAAFRTVSTGIAALRHIDGGRPTRATLLDGRLFGSGRSPGQAAWSDGVHVWTWWCAGRACFVARVRADRVERRAAYRYWDGASWARARASARPIGMPWCCQRPSVVRTDGSWVVANLGPADSPAATAWFATAPHPWGPWSPGTSVPLPGCSDPRALATACRAVQVHRAGTGGSGVRLSWFNPTVPTGASREGEPLMGVTFVADIGAVRRAPR